MHNGVLQIIFFKVESHVNGTLKKTKILMSMTSGNVDQFNKSANYVTTFLNRLKVLLYCILYMMNY